MDITPQESREKEGKETSSKFEHQVETTSQHTFSPQQINVRVGDVVRWLNSTSEVHTVTLDPKLVVDPKNCELPDGAETFDSGLLKPGKDFEYQFTVPGRYRYFCQTHELMGMIGEVIVK